MSNPNLLWGENVTFDRVYFPIEHVVVLFLTIFGILYALLSRGDENQADSHARLRKQIFRFLTTSMWCYLLSYCLAIINWFLWRREAGIVWGETFTQVFSNGWFYLADFIVLRILCQLTYYQFPLWGASGTFHAAWRFLCMILLTLLVALALSGWAINTASTILSLNGVYSAFTENLLRESDMLWTGYWTIYTLLSTLILLLVVYNIGRRITFREKLNIVEGSFFAIALLLWIRSASRLYFVVKYIILGETGAFYISTVFDALYGVSTVIIYVLFNHLNKPAPVSVAKSDILREGRRTARKELKRRRVDADKGGPALPTPAQLLAEIESKPLAYLPDQGEASMSSLINAEVQDILSRHIRDVLKIREKI